MDQHPIPRQITTFEFKLIGFLTLKQFLYLLVFCGLGFVAYLLFPIPILNILLGILVGGAGVAFAFVPINDRPLDVWLRNLVKRLLSPTQYQYKKNNQAPKYLMNMVTTADKNQITSHIDSQKKLSNYLGKNPPSNINNKQSINDLLQQSLSALGGAKPKTKESGVKKQASAIPAPSVHKHFFSGLVKNHKNMPLYGLLIYVKKNEKDEPLRILKSNVNGVFATYSPLPPGDYFFEIKDPQGLHFFDTMKIKVEGSNPSPFEFISKETL